MNRRPFVIILLPVLVLPGLLAFAFIAKAKPPHAHKAPAITWDLASVEESLVAGAAASVEISFVPSRDLPPTNVRVVPELRPFLDAIPGSFGAITEGERTTLALEFKTPPDHLPGMFEGTLQLRGDRRPGTIARPIPISLEITWPSERITTDFWEGSITYPPDLRPDLEGTFGEGTDLRAAQAIFSGETDGSLDKFFVRTERNSASLSLDEWVEREALATSYDRDVRLEKSTVSGFQAVRLQSASAHRVGYYVYLGDAVVGIEWPGFHGLHDSRILQFEEFVSSLRLRAR